MGPLIQGLADFGNMESVNVLKNGRWALLDGIVYRSNKQKHQISENMLLTGNEVRRTGSPNLSCEPPSILVQRLSMTNATMHHQLCVCTYHAFPSVL